MDFQFVSESSRKTLRIFMKKADSYGDYVKLLTDHVISTDDIPDDLILLALRHADYLGRRNVGRELIETQQTRDVVLPYYVMLHAAERDDWDIALQELETAIDRSSRDWIAYWYLIKLYWLAMTRALDPVTAAKAEERIDQMLEEKTSIHCFSPQYYYLKANAQRYERGMKGPLQVLRLGLEKAREFDDRYFEARCLKSLGAMIGYYDLAPGSVEEGMSLLLEAKKICEELGDPRGLIEVLSYLGGINATVGAFMDNLNANLEMLRVRELIGDKPVYEFHNIAAAYCALQDPKEALEWARLAIDSASSRPLLTPIVHLDLAAALILNGKLNQAKEHINTARRLSLETGIESNLAYEYKTSGLLERAAGDYDSAMHSFESALEIEERNSRVNRVITTLTYLAETEVASFQATRESRDVDVSGPWLQRYESTAVDNQLRGHIGIARCLKSELRLRQGRHEEARTLADEVMRLSEQAGLEYLRNRATQLLDTLAAEPQSKSRRS
jgi:tetratricopeptide (TPR) repeat protein